MRGEDEGQQRRKEHKREIGEKWRKRKQRGRIEKKGRGQGWWQRLKADFPFLGHLMYNILELCNLGFRQSHVQSQCHWIRKGRAVTSEATFTSETVNQRKQGIKNESLESMKKQEQCVSQWNHTIFSPNTCLALIFSILKTLEFLGVIKLLTWQLGLGTKLRVRQIIHVKWNGARLQHLRAHLGERNRAYRHREWVAVMHHKAEEEETSMTT